MNNKKICWWCKHNKKETDEPPLGPMTMDCQTCSKCGKECVPSSLMYDE